MFWMIVCGIVIGLLIFFNLAFILQIILLVLTVILRILTSRTFWSIILILLLTTVGFGLLSAQNYIGLIVICIGFGFSYWFYEFYKRSTSLDPNTLSISDELKLMSKKKSIRLGLLIGIIMLLFLFLGLLNAIELIGFVIIGIAIIIIIYEHISDK